jgi:cysteine-rich repeat protein
VDIADPEHPTQVGEFDTKGFAFVVNLVGSKAYVADRLGGIVMIDVSDPYAPVAAGHCATPGEAYGVATDGELIYVGDFYLFEILSTDTTDHNPAELPECGNGVVESGEECDDGNPTANDGCNADCRFDAAICGNAVFNVGEECDDGNLVGGDGCDAGCRLEPAVCGNGILESGEECDDGNLVSDDGCDASCYLQGVTTITLSVGTSHGNDTLIQGVPGSLLFKVEAPNTTQIAGFVFPMIYRFSNGNIIGPVEQGSGDAYVTFSPKAHATLDLLSWHPTYGRTASDPYVTLVGLTRMTSPLWTGSGELWRITFSPLDTGVITIDGTNLPPSNYLSVYSPQAQELPIQWQPKTITVIPGLPTGNVNGDTLTNAADLIYLVNFLFREGPLPTPCEACGDVNCSGSVNTLDIMNAINYVFKEGQRPCNVGGLVNSSVWSCPREP